MGYVDAIKDLASIGRHAGARVRSRARPSRRSATPSARRRKPASREVMERAMEFYRAELKKAPRAIEYLKGRGLTGRDRGALRHRLRARRLAGPEGASSRNTSTRRWSSAGLVIANEGKRYDRFRDRVMFPILERARRGDRLRRPRAGRGRAEVPEFAGDAAVREGARALRPGAGARRDARGRARAGGRGLHGRGGAGAVRRRLCGGHARHRDHAGARARSCCA